MSEETPVYRPFEHNTRRELWTEPHLAEQMLRHHLDPAGELASRRSSTIAEEVDWLVDRFGLGEGKRVLDLGCGPGLHAMALAKRGASVLGVDFSPRAIAYAKEQSCGSGLDLAYLEGDYLELGLDREFDLVCLLFCDFGAIGPAERRQVLDVVRAHLAPGGRFVFDVHGLGHWEAFKEGETVEERGPGFWSTAPHRVREVRRRFPAQAVCLNHFFVEESERTREFWNWTACYSREALDEELGRAGWAIATAHGDVRGRPFARGLEEWAVVTAPVG